jgi:NAD(P)-dependent dehydrogenase (short-subunit alcohol dehydrogenase family)
MGKLAGKVAIVTGAGRGIGRGIARGLAREGAALALAARSESELNAAAEEMRAIGVEVLAAPADVTDEAQVEALFARVHDEFGR